MSRTSARKPFGAKPDSKSSGGKSGGEAASMGLRDQNPTYLKELKRTAMMAGISALVIGIGGTMYLNRSGKQVQSAAQVAAAQAAAVN